jgi:inner membrane protein
MLLFAHTGIALGGAFIVERLLQSSISKRTLSNPGSSTNKVPAGGKGMAGSSQTARPKTGLFGNIRFDYRFILLGSMLPDIIDKPLGQLILRNFMSNGRIFSHTLIFLLLLCLAGFLVYRFYKKSWFIFLAYGVFVHFLLDAMWLTPCTLFWPACGFAFPKYDLENWGSMLLGNLFHDPATYIPEAIGAAIVVYVSVKLLATKSVWKFIKTGYLWN